jgi:hypothetical protein
MRSARLSTAGRGSMLALAVAFAALSAARVEGQGANVRMQHRGAILVQTMDTAINPLAADIALPAFGLALRLSDEGAVLLMNIPDGTYLIQARHLGHRPDWRFVRIDGDTAQADFILPPADVAKGGSGLGLAESRLRDFLRRSAAIQQASFITRAEIDRRRPRNLVALLARMSELTVDRGGSGAAVLRSKGANRSGCASGRLIFVDGMLPNPLPAAAGFTETAADRRSPRGLRTERAMLGAGTLGSDAAQWSTAAPTRAPADVPSGRTSGRRIASPLDWIPISLVAGVEVYPSGDDVPLEFQVAGAECGAVLVWTVRR